MLAYLYLIPHVKSVINGRISSSHVAIKFVLHITSIIKLSKLGMSHAEVIFRGIAKPSNAYSSLSQCN